MTTTNSSAIDGLRKMTPLKGVLIEGGAGMYMEVTDTTDRMIWMCVDPVTREDYAALAVEPPLVKSGIGQASMDSALFLRSPGDAQHVRERVIDGRRFINVATPVTVAPSPEPGGPLAVIVDKAHVLGFDAGRTLSVLKNDAGYFIEMAGTHEFDEERVLPSGSEIILITITEPWIVALPQPTKTWFWMGEHVRSFQGPIELPPTNSQ